MTSTLRMWWTALGLIASVQVSAHELHTASLRLDESSGGIVLATLNTPLAKDGQPISVVPRFDARCFLTGEPNAIREPARIIREWHLQCEGGLTGTRISFEGLDPSTPEALITAHFANGATQILAVDRHDPFASLSAESHRNAASSLTAYLPIGIEHILLGPDHLLFVLGLMLIVSARQGGLRLLVAALTAFTLAHSLTLGLAMFGIWGLPPKPVEILIALSIVLLAVELAGHPRNPQQPTLTLRKPWLVAFVFGLLHGFGFAGALSEIGLPQAARGWALFLFNVGVEIGQLLFVGAVFILMWLARQWRPLQKIQPAFVVVCLGAVAVYWVLDRTAVWLQASNLLLHVRA